MNQVDAVAVGMTRKDLQSTRLRRAGVAGTRSAMLLLAAAGALAGAGVAQADGAVVAWGRNDFGQCTTPQGIGTVTAIAAGDNHTVALNADGAVVAWGTNSWGQCTTPPGLGVVTAIAAGREYTVAIGPSCEEQLAAAQAVIVKLTAVNAQQATEILLLNARIAILQLGDLNEDGVIDSGDLATLLNSWGVGGK